MGDIAGAVVDGADCDDNGPFTQVRNKRKKSKKPSMLQNQSKTNSLIDEVLQSVASQRDSPPASGVGRSDSTSPRRDRVFSQTDDNDPASELLALKKTVQELTTIVGKLSNQLNFVLSYLDINDVTAISSVDTGLSSSAVVAATENNATLAVDGVTATASAAVVHRPTSITAAVPVTHGVRARPQPASLKEAVVTAVHNDHRDRERRARTVIVSGLKQQNTKTDADCFRQLTVQEFGVDPAIKFTKRLGSTADNRVQLLLVGLQSADQATSLIQRAKQLRSSTDEYVCRCVYINRNLTAVESKLAYEERCRRRRQMSQQRHTGRQQNFDDRRVQSSQTATGSQPASAPSTPMPTSVIFNVKQRTALNVNAEPYVAHAADLTTDSHNASTNAQHSTAPVLPPLTN